MARAVVRVGEVTGACFGRGSDRRDADPDAEGDGGEGDVERAEYARPAVGTGIRSADVRAVGSSGGGSSVLAVVSGSARSEPSPPSRPQSIPVANTAADATSAPAPASSAVLPRRAARRRGPAAAAAGESPSASAGRDSGGSGADDSAGSGARGSASVTYGRMRSESKSSAAAACAERARRTAAAVCRAQPHAWGALGRTRRAAAGADPLRRPYGGSRGRRVRPSAARARRPAGPWSGPGP
ncbi:hypothetical protein RB200_19295 [Streptomyces sp. PmtG]